MRNTKALLVARVMAKGREPGRPRRVWVRLAPNGENAPHHIVRRQISRPPRESLTHAGFTCGAMAGRPDTILTRDCVEVSDGNGVSRERTAQPPTRRRARDSEVRGDGHVPRALDALPKPVVVALLRAAVVGMDLIIGGSLTPLNCRRHTGPSAGVTTTRRESAECPWGQVDWASEEKEFFAGGFRIPDELWVGSPGTELEFAL